MAKIDFTRVLVDLEGRPFRELARDHEGRLVDEKGVAIEPVPGKDGKLQLPNGVTPKTIEITLAKLALDALTAPVENPKLSGEAMIDRTIIALEIKKNAESVELESEQITMIKGAIEKNTKSPVMYYRACEALEGNSPKKRSSS